ncbi:inositol 2-dehydrogenase [Fluviibacterium sp. S390]|uniref:inositol 2-dehydrogenase n=1 Tax=Fluviibacterium sp. S390 TaxID=3415139 RepID=UPI003C798ED1
MRIGLLGCGRIGGVHADSIALLREVTLVAVADAFDAPAQTLAARTGAEVRSIDALVASDDIDAVVIGTPTDTHYDLIHGLAAHGKAIFCEKPIDMSADRIRDCIRAVEAAGVPFMTGFNRRFDPNFRDLQQTLRDGGLGNVEIITILSRDPSPPPHAYVRSSGGLFRDMMIHDLDMARFLLGEEPVSIHAIGAALVDPEVATLGDVDTAAVNLITASGKICQISNSRRATYGYDQRIEVHGSKGMLRAGNVHKTTLERADESGFCKSPVEDFFLQRYRAAYAAEMAVFVDSVRAGQPPQPSIHDGLKAQILADAATLSWQSGQVVRLETGSA